MTRISSKKSCVGRCNKCTNRSCMCSKCAEGGSRRRSGRHSTRRSRKSKQRGGDCGCSSGRQLGGQFGGRVTNASEYYGIDSGRYSAGNTATAFLDDQTAQRSSAFQNIAGMVQTVQAGGLGKKDRRSSRRRNAPKYSPKYSNRSRYLIHSRSKKARKSSK